MAMWHGFKNRRLNKITFLCQPIKEGATSGIGHQLAHECVRDGFNLVIVARDEGELSSCKDHFEKSTRFR